MTLHYKIGGVWTQVDRPYLKNGNVWVPVNEVWVKSAGTWQQSYEYDITPSDPPTVSLEVVETEYWDNLDGLRQLKSGRHIKVGIRTPGIAHDTDLQFIRVLTNQADDSPPSTQYGATKLNGAQDGYPDEPWSDFSYNGFNNSNLTKDSSVYHYKTYPRNAGEDAALEAKTYYFTAWSKDNAGNWSDATAAAIVVPKKVVDGTNIKVKEVTFQVSGTGTITADGFTAGRLIQAERPEISRGIYLYGHQFTDNIGQQGPAVIKGAQIQIHRRADAGEPMANVYLWWHDYHNSDAIPVWADIDRNNVTLLGTIGKGDTKWFPLPDTHKTHLIAGDIKGFGLNQKDQSSAVGTAADFSVMKSMDDNLRTGQLHVVWTENLDL